MRARVRCHSYSCRQSARRAGRAVPCELLHPARAAGVDDSLAQRLTVFERPHVHEKTAADAIESGRNPGHIPSPDSESDIHGAPGDHAQNALKNSLPNDFGLVAIPAGEGGWAVYRGGSE